MDGSKTLLWIVAGITGTVGAYIPTWLWQADPLGVEGILGGLVGGLAGIWIWYKFLR